LILNLIQLTQITNYKRTISNVNNSFLSELDGLAQGIKEDTVPDSLVLSQASKVAALSDFSSYKFHYGHTLETRLLEMHNNKQPVHNAPEIKDIITSLKKNFSNDKLINRLDSLLNGNQ
jgi:hypothetical protein